MFLQSSVLFTVDSRVSVFPLMIKDNLVLVYSIAFLGFSILTLQRFYIHSNHISSLQFLFVSVSFVVYSIPSLSLSLSCAFPSPSRYCSLALPFLHLPGIPICGQCWSALSLVSIFCSHCCSSICINGRKPPHPYRQVQRRKLIRLIVLLLSWTWKASNGIRTRTQERKINRSSVLVVF